MDVKNYIQNVSGRLSKAFDFDEFGTEQELEFWSLSAEHLSQHEIPSFTDIVSWMDLLYKAPVHFVYERKEDELVLSRRHVIADNIQSKDIKEEKNEGSEAGLNKKLQSFEYQLDNLEKKKDWENIYLSHGVSVHSIGKCEHIPLYDTTGEIWGVYFAGPDSKCPEQMVAKLSIVGRLLSRWLSALKNQEQNPKKEYDQKIKNVASELGTGRLNVEAFAHLKVGYVRNLIGADSVILASYTEVNGVNVLASSFKDDNLSEELEANPNEYLAIENEELASEKLESLITKPQVFKRSDKERDLFIVMDVLSELDENTHDVIQTVLSSISKLLLFEEKNVSFSGELLDKYYNMLRVLEKKRNKTHYHTPRLIALSQKFGLFFGLDKEELKILEKTARYHDIGYIGALTIESRRSIGGEMSHPQIGAMILEQLPLHEDIVEGVRTHHEWVNGKGAPFGLTGDEIPWTGKIIGVFEYVVDFIESDQESNDEELLKKLSKQLMKRADEEFDMVLIPTAIQVLQSLGWEQCKTLGTDEEE